MNRGRVFCSRPNEVRNARYRTNRGRERKTRPLICPSSCQGDPPGPSGNRRPTPGSYSWGRPHLICPRLDNSAYPSRGSALDLTDAQTGSLSDTWLRPWGRPYFDALCQAVSLVLPMKSVGACPRCAGRPRVACACSGPRPGRMGCLGDSMSLCAFLHVHPLPRLPAPRYAAAPSPRCSSCTWSPMTHIQRTSSFTTATLALFAFLRFPRARWS